MNLFLALTIPSLILLYLFKYIYFKIWFPLKVKIHFVRQGINGPKYRPIYGNSEEVRNLFDETLKNPMNPLNHDIVHRADPFCHKWFNKCGKTFIFFHGSIPRLGLLEPEMVKEVMLNKSGFIGKAKMPPLAKQLFGKGLVDLHGENWAFHRKIANRAFLMDRIKVIFFLFFLQNSSFEFISFNILISIQGWIPEFVDCTGKMMKNWEVEIRGEKDEFEVDVKKEFHKLSAEILSRTLFGSSFEEGKLVFELQEQQSMLTMKALREVNLPGLR